MEGKWVLFQGFRELESAKTDAEKENGGRKWREKWTKKDPQDGDFPSWGPFFI